MPSRSISVRSRISRFLLSSRSLTLLLFASLAHGQEHPTNWQAQVRGYADKRDWSAALLVIGAEIARAPQDLDLKAWRARVLTWAGRLDEAERGYSEILDLDRSDPDNWRAWRTSIRAKGRSLTR